MSIHVLPTTQVYQVSVNETGKDDGWYPIAGQHNTLPKAIWFRDKCLLPRYNKRQRKKLLFRICQITTTEMFVDDLGNPCDNATDANELKA